MFKQMINEIKSLKKELKELIDLIKEVKVLWNDMPCPQVANEDRITYELVARHAKAEVNDVFKHFVEDLNFDNTKRVKQMMENLVTNNEPFHICTVSDAVTANNIAEKIRKWGVSVQINKVYAG